MIYYLHEPFQGGVVVPSKNTGVSDIPDFVMTVGGEVYRYGFLSGSWGAVQPKAWNNSETNEIKALVVNSVMPFLIFRATEMQAWSNYANVALKMWNESGSVETSISNGFLFTETRAEYLWNDEQSEVYAFLEANVGKDVYVKVIDSSLPTNENIEIKIGLFESSLFKALGYRAESSTGDTSGTYNSGNAITALYVRDYYYGMLLQSEIDNEYWSGWKYMNAVWSFEDGTTHAYAGRLLMHKREGFYASSVIDDELIALAQSNIDKQVTVTLSHSEEPSNIIEIEIGEINISSSDTAYGLRASSSTGTLIAGEFPDASAVANAYVRTERYGCLVGGSFERTYWNYLDAIKVTWEFEDGTSYEFPEKLEYYYNSGSAESFYKSDYIDEKLISLISAKVGQTARIVVTEIETSKLINNFRLKFDGAAKA